MYLKRAVLWSFLFAGYCDCVNFFLSPHAQKCLREELSQNVLVNGEYDVIDHPGQKVDYVVRDSKGQILSQKEDIQRGKFSFISETYDTFEICFISRVPQHQRAVAHEVQLNLKTGVEAKSYDKLAEVEKLKPMEVELKRLEELSDAIVRDFAYMKKREEEMINTNESTTNRVFYLSIFSICTLLGLASWQIFYLRRYFKSKKLID